jgi:molybdopterin-guanine dinucleotide biosynthesis protein A
VTSDRAGRPAVAAIVLCGGQGRRFGGDKTRADLGGTSVLDALIAGLPQAWHVVCVGAERPVGRPGTVWVREEPPGGGPVAGIAAGLGQVRADIVVVLAGDMPYAAAAADLLARRLAEHPEAEAVVAEDPSGRVQPLLAAFRARSLRSALPAEPSGAPAKLLLEGLRVVREQVSAGQVMDVDTPADLRAAREAPPSDLGSGPP